MHAKIWQCTTRTSSSICISTTSMQVSMIVCVILGNSYNGLLSSFYLGIIIRTVALPCLLSVISSLVLSFCPVFSAVLLKSIIAHPLCDSKNNFIKVAIIFYKQTLSIFLSLFLLFYFHLQLHIANFVVLMHLVA